MPTGLSRRNLLVTGLAATWAKAHAITPPMQVRSRPLLFPRDFGSHPDFSIEWWYLTGRLQSDALAQVLGFQITFFRSRVASTQSMKSAFAAKQLLFAHATVTDVAKKKLWHDQRVARGGFGLAQASETDTAVHIHDWSLARLAEQYKTTARGDDFQFELTLRETQPLLLQGQAGLSRKGPDAAQTSHYYSLPHLRAQGSVMLQGQRHDVQGTAWLDHEWSDSLLHPQAVGWDWIGMNLLDGSALTAFRLRASNSDSLWDGGSWRSQGGSVQDFSQGSVSFEPLRHWLSPLTKTRYPVEWRVQTPAGRFTVKAIIYNQELDSRQSTGAIYWEGLSELMDEQGNTVGHGYLEMTGYASPLRL
ncbi:carotenoid 1,2-hydratase [Rhodoferax sp. PAMC 29310]|uniref:lipocalin-like domain-containing protein n=1 Tax=Rhodoferax sp. PAMC 29310 TaxID=2822760 RepID=UPI001B31BE58|nr:carotenoid 1,2-hydratase [Rhodoferax sp. PAMC 29310]